MQPSVEHIVVIAMRDCVYYEICQSVDVIPRTEIGQITWAREVAVIKSSIVYSLTADLSLGSHGTSLR